MKEKRIKDEISKEKNNLKITHHSVNTLCDDPTLYQSLVRALQYLTSTRPNISYVVQQACLHMYAPYTEHMLTLK